MPILDSHTHAFPDALAPAALAALSTDWLWEPVRPYHGGTVASLLASMDAAGIDQAILCSIATRPGQVRKISDWSIALLAHPAAAGRIHPFASIHPDYECPEEECERLAAAGIRGLKFHPYYQIYPADHPKTLRVVHAAARHHLAVAFHAGYDLSFPKDDVASPQALRRVFEAVPDLRLQCCHLGGWQRWPEVLHHLAGLPIYFETSYTLAHCPLDLLLRILDVHPSTHLLWGTDSPWKTHSDELARFHALPIPQAVKTAALWDNAQCFLQGP